jgi:hypothetical protein
MTDSPQLTDLELTLLIIERDICQYKKERIDELLNKIGEARGISRAIETPSTAPTPNAKDEETAFTLLKFEAQKGAQLGDFDVAYKANNIEDKWTYVFNTLRNSHATIKDRYHGEGYQFSYWVYGEGKIYRQKLKQKT